MDVTGAALCGEDEMAALIASVQASDGDDLVSADRLLARFPDDPRLHFLRGSLLASIGRPIEARAALKQAVELAPDFAIARFQLGFFQLTSGEALDALESWGPLTLLPEDHYLRLFVAGLTFLVRDEFAETIANLQAGIAANDENPALNRDMQLIIDQVGVLMNRQGRSEDAGDGSISATSLLLGQLVGHGRPN